MELTTKCLYPNPFQPIGIEFTLSEDAVITLELVDDSGKPVSIPINKAHYPKGTHTFDIKLKGLTVPAQYYRIIAETSSGQVTDLKKIS